MVNAICEEIKIRKSYLNSTPIKTLYFGGGTPSILSAKQLHQIIDTLHVHFNLSELQEVTIEGNPDDLTFEKLHEIKESGFNRLSIGIQSFNDKVLTFLNRAHNTLQSHECIENSYKLGFENISLDFIFGIPDVDENYIDEQLKSFLSFSPPHISAYHLTIESGTAFGHWLAQKKLREIEEETSEKQFHQIRKKLVEHSYLHYEISNYSRLGYESQHNSSYWKQSPYLGIGPGAHSYDGKSRSFNISNNVKYIKMIQQNKYENETEYISTQMKYNEYIMTSLRTKKGCDIAYIRHEFGSIYVNNILKKLKNNWVSTYVETKKNVILLKDRGLMLADQISSELFEV